MNAVGPERRGLPGIGRAATAELIATFAFVLASGGAVVASELEADPLTVALATGLALGVMVSAVADLSGGHLNPAVTVGLWVVGRIGSSRAVAYLGAQLLGAVMASLLLRFLIPSFLYDAAAGGVPRLSPVLGAGRGIGIEATATFVLLFVYLATMVDRRETSPRISGSLVGLAAAVNVMAFGAYTGAAMNPARWLGPAFAAQQFGDWYVWVTGPLIGGIAGAILYRGVFTRGPGRNASPPTGS